MKGFVITLTLIFFQNSFACINGKDFFPKNNLRIPVSVKNTGITENAFYSIADEFQDLYEPIFKQLGSRLKINKNWKSSMVNARAHRRGRTRFVTMFGGMARHKEMTELGYALVICHEIGHHLGGAPTYFSGMSNEGQSDYFAATKCMRRWLRTKSKNTMITSPFLVQKCSDIYSNENEINHCVQTSLGGMSLARIFAQLQNVDMPEFTTPDTNVVSRTSFKHPAAQCRLDTYFQAALCDNDIDTPFSTRDALQGACHQAHGDLLGYRPACWYKAEI